MEDVDKVQSDPEIESTQVAHQWLIPCVLVICVLMIIKNAWLSDDAYITFRTVDNFIHGYGLRWNVAERVQSFTNPLMMFAISFLYWITREVYYTSLIFSIVVSTGALWILTKSSKNTASLVVGLTLFTFSNAFVDYSTSGLENPLTHLILALFIWRLQRVEEPSLYDLSHLLIITSLLQLNRLDTVLLVAPMLGWVLFKVWQAKNNSIGEILLTSVLSMSLLIVWELFSIVYYGSFVPNTAFAKLNTGLSSWELMLQGCLYYLNSVQVDPITIVGLLMGLVGGFFHKTSMRATMLSLGVMLYCLYIIKVGGDFMSGRFLAAPLFCSVAVLATSIEVKWEQALVLMVTIVGVGVSTPNNPVLTRASYGSDVEDTIRNYGVADEKMYYYPRTGLLRVKRGEQEPRVFVKRYQKLSQKLEKYTVRGAVGFSGFFLGPEFHIVDNMALCDPLLSRLPTTNLNDWRIGHFKRAIPAGYVETLESGENRLQDPNLAEFYQTVQLITRGPIWSADRLVAILKMNLGMYNHLLQPTVEE